MAIPTYCRISRIICQKSHRSTRGKSLSLACHRYKASTAAAINKYEDNLHHNGQVIGREENQSSSTSSDSIDLTFNNTKECFKSKTSFDLIRALVVLKLCSYPYLVDNHQKLIKLGQTVLGRRLFRVLMKSSFYGHFVAGEDEREIKPKITHLSNFGVKSILDYSAEDEIEEEAKVPDVKLSNSNEGQPDSNVKENLKKFVAAPHFADPRKYHVTARTYFYMNEVQCEKNMEIFLKCIDAVAGITNQTGFAAIKLTALCRPQLLLKLSKFITETRPLFKDSVNQGETKDTQSNTKTKPVSNDDHPLVQGMTESQRMMINLLSWNELIDLKHVFDHFSKNTSVSGESKCFQSPLTAEEEEMFGNMVRRVETIARHAKLSGVRVLIDAEQTYLQPVINRVTVELMKKYNKNESIIFNTYQCYLKSAFDTMLMDLNISYLYDFHFGAKLVRGAYLEQERLRAKEIGYEDPINESFEKTSEMYHKTLHYLMQEIVRNKIESKRIAIMVASHNEDTVRFAVENMKNLGIKPVDKVICFGQLYAMSDHISFSLGQSGYSAYKYIPYGPVDEVMPYLSRRAIENSSILVKSARERGLLRKEISRRLLNGEFFHRPRGNYRPV